MSSKASISTPIAKAEYDTAVLAWNGVFRKAMDTQFIIIVDKDTMVSIIYPKCDDAVVHQIAEIYYGIHSIPKILLWYIITKYPNMLPRYLKENQSPLITSWRFLVPWGTIVTAKPLMLMLKRSACPPNLYTNYTRICIQII